MPTLQSSVDQLWQSAREAGIDVGVWQVTYTQLQSIAARIDQADADGVEPPAHLLDEFRHYEGQLRDATTKLRDGVSPYDDADAAGRSSKTKVVALLLILLLGGLAADRFYLRKWGEAIGRMVTWMGGYVVLFMSIGEETYEGSGDYVGFNGFGIVIGLALLLGSGIWWVVNLIRIIRGTETERDGLPLS